MVETQDPFSRAIPSSGWPGASSASNEPLAPFSPEAFCAKGAGPLWCPLGTPSTTPTWV